ncbi:MAG TPA: PKD domain-containing protein, partial [Nevskiaceae bacterium]|nr:PKD domain-containing protein [Nevskiaceae bacterium]
AALVADISSGNAPLTVHLNASGSSDPSGDTITSYTFSFGDGSDPVTQAGPTIAHTYGQDGLYAATVTAKNSHGVQSSNVARQLITVGAGAASGPSKGRFGGALPLVSVFMLMAAALVRRRRH